VLLENALEHRKLVGENADLKRRLVDQVTDTEILGSAPGIQRVLETVAAVADADANVLIVGESGTGKELLARFIHERSARSRGPFVAVNCSAIPETILEAELFGHERGAFTGAIARREGRFAKASGGTLFLDEIGELSPQVQVKLLRVLQEGEYDPVGGDTVKADVRIVAATNRDLAAEVEAGRFRQDLLFRIVGATVWLPPLRDRRREIPILAHRFLADACRRAGRDAMEISAEAMQLLHRHRIEKLLVVDDDYHLVGLITVKDIEKRIKHPAASKDPLGRLYVGAAVGVGEELLAGGLPATVVALPFGPEDLDG
jgi:two-component system response regulator HydG